jgi:hypothetical protein
VCRHRVHSWASNDGFGSSNAVAMLGIVDPAKSFIVEVHPYLDSESPAG